MYSSVTRPMLFLLLLPLPIVGSRKSKSTRWQQRLQQSDLTTSQFTDIMASAIRETVPDCKVKVVKSF